MPAGQRHGRAGLSRHSEECDAHRASVVRGKAKTREREIGPSLRRDFVHTKALGFDPLAGGF